MEYIIKYWLNIRILLFVLICIPIVAFTQEPIFLKSINYNKNKNKVYAYLKSIDSNKIEHILNDLPNDSKAIYFIQYGKLLFKQNQIDKSESYLKRAIELFDDQTIEMGMADVFFYSGKISALKKETESTVKNFTSAIQIYLSHSNFDNTCISYMEIANYFSKLGNKSSAEIYYKKSFDNLKKTSNSNVIDLVKFNFANHANTYKDYDDALSIYLELSKKESAFPNLTRSSYILNNIGAIYLAKEEWSSAQTYLHKSLKIKRQLKDTVGIISTLTNLLRTAISSKDTESAIETLHELNNIFHVKPPNIKEQILFSYNKIGYYALIGKTELIGKELGNYNLLKDSLSNIAFSDKLVEMQKSFEIQERDKNIALLQKEDELKEARLSNQLIVIISIGAVLLLLVVLGYFINKQRVKLKRSESHLKKQQKRIKQINSDLKTSNLAKDRILSIIGHDLRGPIGGLKELIELYMDMPGYEEEDFKSLLKAAREASAGSYYLLENLLTWANSQRGQIDFKPVTAPLLPLAKTSIDLLDSSINTRNVSFKYDISPGIKLTADLNMLRTIIRNLVSNAVKYSPPESCITISATQNNEETFICIADQGYGMTAEQSSALFEKKETYFIEAGYNAKGSGLGLVLCREFVEQHKGKIWADSIPNKGTKVCFTIPLNIDQPKTTSALHKHTPAMN